MARPVKVVSAAKLSRGLTADTTVYLSLIEVAMEGNCTLCIVLHMGLDSNRLG